MAQEIFEQVEFLGGQFKALRCPGNLVRYEIHLEILMLQLEELVQASTPEQCPDAREQLREGERLRKVVVGALVEANYSILHGILRRKDQHWSLIAALAQRRKNIDAVPARQHEIEQQKVERTLACKKESFFSGGRSRNLIVLRLKAFSQRVRNLLFVFNDQNAHCVLRRESRSRIGL
jgi:hypothetical protein